MTLKRTTLRTSCCQIKKKKKKHAAGHQTAPTDLCPLSSAHIDDWKDKMHSDQSLSLISLRGEGGPVRQWPSSSALPPIPLNFNYGSLACQCKSCCSLEKSLRIWCLCTSVLMRPDSQSGVSFLRYFELQFVWWRHSTDLSNFTWHVHSDKMRFLSPPAAQRLLRGVVVARTMRRQTFWLHMTSVCVWGGGGREITAVVNSGGIFRAFVLGDSLCIH